MNRLIIITVIAAVILLILGIVSINAGDYRKACESTCLADNNLTFVEQDYFSHTCSCVYKLNNTKISKQVSTSFGLGPFF